MKNVVKKSKFVILPALATLVLTGVASVTGTVAWFTANRAATLSGAQFQAKALDSSLKMTVTALTGTTGGSTQAGSTQSIAVDGLLTHGSYDLKSKTAFTALASDNYVTGYSSVGAFDKSTSINTWQAAGNSTNDKVWYAVSWKITFSQQLNSNSEKIAVLFNPSASNYSNSQKVNAGFETAMFTLSDNSIDKSLVFGNDNHKKHVKSAGTVTASYTQVTESASFDAETEYFTKDNDRDTYSKVLNPSAGNKTSYYTRSYDLSQYEDSFDKYFQTDAKYVPLSDKDNKLTSTNEYLGTLDKDHTTLDVYCVAWYEGTDAAVITTNIIDTAITSTLGFYSRII